MKLYSSSPPKNHEWISCLVSGPKVAPCVKIYFYCLHPVCWGPIIITDPFTYFMNESLSCTFYLFHCCCWFSEKPSVLLKQNSACLPTYLPTKNFFFALIKSYFRVWLGINLSLSMPDTGIFLKNVKKYLKYFFRQTIKAI